MLTIFLAVRQVKISNQNSLEYTSGWEPSDQPIVLLILMACQLVNYNLCHEVRNCIHYE